MLLKKDHPWNPGYALPENVLEEPTGRGTFTTRQAPRGTISDPFAQSSWTTGYALPENVLAEPPGQGVIETYQRPRGTVDFSIPKPFVAPPDFNQVMASGVDPIANFGRESVAIAMAEVKRHPVAKRPDVMKEIMDEIDPGLWNEVAGKATALRKKYKADIALERAFSGAMSNHLVKQLMHIGKTGSQPLSGVLACADCESVGLGGIGSFFKNIGKKISSGTKSVVKGIGKVACKAVNNDLVRTAAMPAGAAVGGPAGAAAASAGANIAGGLCASGSGAQALVTPPPPPALDLTKVALIGGGVLVAVLLITRK